MGRSTCRPQRKANVESCMRGHGKSQAHARRSLYAHRIRREPWHDPPLICLLFFIAAALSSTAHGQVVDGVTEVFLCGFDAKQDCDFARQPTCQLFQVADCTRFTSTAFEEFGLEEIYVRVDRTGDTYSYRIFITSECTGDPYGITVQASGMAIRQCQPLVLPFVGNQADFMFVLECEQCDRGSSLLPQVGDLPPGIVTIDYPRKNGYLFSSVVSAPCALLGMRPANLGLEATPPTEPLRTPDVEPYMWIEDGLGLARSEVIRRLWCNATMDTVRSAVFRLTVLQGTSTIMLPRPLTSPPLVHYSVLSFCCIPTPPTQISVSISNRQPDRFNITISPPYTRMRIMFHAFVPGTDGAVATAAVDQRYRGSKKLNPWPFTIGVFRDTSPFGAGEQQDLQIHFTEPPPARGFTPASLHFNLESFNQVYGGGESLPDASVARPPQAPQAVDTTRNDVTGNIRSVGVGMGVPQNFPSGSIVQSTTTTPSSLEAYTDAVVPGRGPRVLFKGDTAAPPVAGAIFACEYATLPRCHLRGPTTCHPLVAEQCQHPPPTSALSRVGSVRPTWDNGQLRLLVFENAYCTSALSSVAFTAAVGECVAAPQTTATAYALRFLLSCDQGACRVPTTAAAPTHPIVEAEHMALRFFHVSNPAWEVAAQTFDGVRVTGVRTTDQLEQQPIGALLSLTASRAGSLDATFLLPAAGRSITADLHVRAACDPTGREGGSTAVLLAPLVHISGHASFPVTVPCDGTLHWVHAGNVALDRVATTMTNAPIEITLRNAGQQGNPRIFLDKLALAPPSTPLVPSILQGARHLPCSTFTASSACPPPRCDWHPTEGCRAPAPVACAHTNPELCPSACELNTSAATAPRNPPSPFSPPSGCAALDQDTSHPNLCTAYVLHVTSTTTDSSQATRTVLTRTADLVTPVARVQRWVDDAERLALVQLLWTPSSNNMSVPTPTVAVLEPAPAWPRSSSPLWAAFPPSLSALLVHPSLLAIETSSLSASSTSSGSNTGPVISPSLSNGGAAAFTALGPWVQHRVRLRCQCARLTPSVTRIAPTRAVVVVETTDETARPTPRLSVDLKGGRGFWDWDGLALNLVQLAPETEYKLTLSPQENDVGARCMSTVTRHVTFRTPARLPNLRALAAHPLSDRDVLFQWSADIDRIADSGIVTEPLPASSTATDATSLLASLFFRVYLDGAPVALLSALSATAVRQQQRTGAAATDADGTDCRVNEEGRPYIDVAADTGVADAPVFETVVRGLQNDTGYRFSVQLFHPVMGPLSRRAFPIRATTLPALHTARARVTRAVSLTALSAQRALLLQWEPTVLANGLQATAYRVQRLDVQESGARRILSDSIILNATSTRLRLPTLFEVRVQPLFIDCWLSTLSACMPYLESASSQAPITAVNASTEASLALRRPPVIRSHAMQSDGSLVFLLLEEVVVGGLSLWAVRDSNGRHVDLARSRTAAINQDQSTLTLSPSLSPHTLYAFVLRSTDGDQAPPYELLAPQAEPSRPDDLTPTATSARSFTLQVGTPDPLNGVLVGFRLQLSIAAANSTRVLGSVVLPASRLPDGGVRESPMLMSVEGLQGGRTYSVNITATTEAGTGPGATVEITTAEAETGPGNVGTGSDSGATGTSSSSSAIRAAVAALLGAQATTPSSPPPPPSSLPSSSYARPVGNSGMAAAGLCGVVVGAVVAAIVWRMADHRVRAAAETHMSTAGLQDELTFILDKRFAASSVGQVPATDLPAMEVRVSQVILRRQLSSGRLGAVYDAIFKAQPALVHQVHSHNRMFDVASLVAEARVLGAVHHPNVIEVLGIASQVAPVLILHEKADLGDLRQFIQQEGDRRGLGASLTVPDLIGFAQQVADGMQHLHEQSIVNGALQLDALLLSRSKRVKIHRLARLDSYQSPFPVVRHPWKAVELFQGDEELTKPADVWAFGVVMWEMFTYGQKPFASLNEQQVLSMLSEGKRLSPPDIVPERVVGLMFRCWGARPTERPVFADLSERLESEVAILRGIVEHRKANLNRKYNFGL